MANGDGRVALQTALGALAGGAEGYVKQQDYNRLAREREEEAKRRQADDVRQRLADAFSRANAGVRQIADPAVTYDPEQATRFTADGITYEMPTAGALARQAAETQRRIDEQNTQIKRRNAFRALQETESSYRGKTYDPEVPYETLYQTITSERVARTQGAQAAARDEATRREQRKEESAIASAWWQRTTNGLAADSPEMLAAQRLYQQTFAALRSQGLPSTPGDVTFAIYKAVQAERGLRGSEDTSPSDIFASGAGGGAGAGGGNASADNLTPEQLPRRGESRYEYFQRLMLIRGMTRDRGTQLANKYITDAQDAEAISK